MDLEKVTAKIRPRKGWESVDLGVALAQQHLIPLYKIWFLTTLPFFLLISIISYQDSIWGYIVFWWLKPIWERPLLHFLSRELFGERLSVKSCVSQIFKLAKIQWFASLTWRRLSFTRSLDLPIIQLEGLAGEQRSSRLKVIHSVGSGASVWLTILFVFTEIILYFGFLALAYILLPTPISESINFFQWITADAEGGITDFLMILLTYLSVSIIAPFYVACGFSIYLNQRTQLEAWDIELAFKRLAKKLELQSENGIVKLASWIPALGFAFLLSTMPASNLFAQENSEGVTTELRKLNADNSENTSGDVTEQITEHDRAKELIKKIKQGEDFHQVTTEHRIVRRKSGDENTSKIKSSNNGSFSFLILVGRIISWIAEFALWVFVVILLLFLIIKYRHLLTGIKPIKADKKRRPKKLFGLDMQSDSLPSQPWKVALELIEQGEFRKATSLLYRASLIWYIDNTAVVIKEGDTELECLSKISRHAKTNDSQFMQQLTERWRKLAYAHQLPEKDDLIHLCQQWPIVLKTDKQIDSELTGGQQ